MIRNTLKSALTDSYNRLIPFSRSYAVDYRRYLFTLELLTSLPHAQQLSYLDLGTGIGILPLSLSALGYTVRGIDHFIFPEAHNEMFGATDMMKLKNQWQSAGVSIENVNVFDDTELRKFGPTDVVVSEAMIEHLKDPKHFLETTYALLRQNGYLLLSTPNSATLLQRVRFLLGRSPNWPIESFFKAGENFTGHWREYTGRELRYMCEESGFTVVAYYNKNLLASFKNIRDWRKNLRAFIALLSWFVPGSREMHYILCQKK